MKKIWTYQYGEDTITVTNTWIDGCDLNVNGQMIDKSNGFFSDTLHGKLLSGEEIKAAIGQSLTGITCTLFVNSKLLNPNFINGRLQNSNKSA